MTTAPQRFLNIVFVVLSTIPVFATLLFFLDVPDAKGLALLAGLVACVPMLVLAVANFIAYRRWTLWHAGTEDGPARSKQMRLALIPAGISLLYALSVTIFFWSDTKPLYLECEISKSGEKDAVGKVISYSIRYIPPLTSSREEYLLFKPTGWFAERAPGLAIRWWDYDSETWEDPLTPFEYPSLDMHLYHQDGGLVVTSDRFVSRGWRYDSEKAAENYEHDQSMQRLLGASTSNYNEPFDHIVISRRTGKFAMHDGTEGVCRKTLAPVVTRESKPEPSTRF
jgi:hypothetical protein